MFNRSSYDRTLYDRSSNFEHVEATLRSTSKLTVGVVIQVYLGAFNLRGGGSVQAKPTMLRVLQIGLSGGSSLAVSDFRLRLRFTSAMNGAGNFVPGIGMRVPFTAAFAGSGKLTDSLMYLLQTVIGQLSGSGNLASPLTLRIYLGSAMSGNGDMLGDNKFKLELPFSSNFNGAGALELRRIGALNSDTLEFENLNLQPGQTLIVDSDELNVFIDNVLDVSSVTSDSVFFQLQPGENEITFVSKDNPNLTVTLVWQNRWL